MPKNVTITLTDKEYADAIRESKKRGLNLAQYCKRFAIGDEDFDSNYEILKEKAVNFSPNGNESL